MSSADAQFDSDTDVVSLMISFGTYLAVSAAFLVGFSVLRPQNKLVYAPRLKFAPPSKRPPPLNAYPFSWLSPAVFADETKLVDKIGLDAVMFLRFLRMLIKLFLFNTVIAIVLCIIHANAQTIVPVDQDAISPSNSGLVANPSVAIMTITNIKNPETQLFYLHTFLAWIVSLFAYYLLYQTWLEYIAFRKGYFSSPEYLESVHSRCVLATEIPEGMNSEEALAAFIASAQLSYPPKKIIMGRDLGKLATLVDQRTKATCALEKVLNDYLRDPNSPPLQRPIYRKGALLGYFGGVTVDAISYWGNEIHRLEREIYEIRSKDDTQFKPNMSAFIEFSTIKGAHSAASKLKGFFKSRLRTGAILSPHFKPSPPFEQIIWGNIGIDPNVRRTRMLIGYAILAGIIIGWTSFQTFLKNLTNPESIARYFPEARSYLKANESMVVFLKSYVGPALVVLSNIVLLLVLRFLGRLQCINSNMGVEKSALYKYFAFQVYNQLVITIMGSGVLQGYLRRTQAGGKFTYKGFWTAVASAIVSPGSTSVLPYLISGYSHYGLEIIQGAPLVIGFLRRRLFNLTPRELYAIDTEPQFDFMFAYGFITLVLLIGMIYSLIVPIIVPFVTVLFILAYIVMKYQLMYVYDVKNETGGSWWKKVFDITCLTLGASQMATFGAIVVTSATKSATGNGKAQSFLVGLLPFVTAVFYGLCVWWLAPKAEYISKTHEAAQMTLSEAKEEAMHRAVVKDDGGDGDGDVSVGGGSPRGSETAKNSVVTLASTPAPPPPPLPPRKDAAHALPSVVEDSHHHHTDAHLSVMHIPRPSFVSSPTHHHHHKRADRVRPEEEDDTSTTSLESRVANPALIKPLIKVWVTRPSRDILPRYYKPEYRDLVDYVKQTKTGSEQQGYLKRARWHQRMMHVFQKREAEQQRHVRRQIQRGGSGSMTVMSGSSSGGGVLGHDRASVSSSSAVASGQSPNRFSLPVFLTTVGRTATTASMGTTGTTTDGSAAGGGGVSRSSPLVHGSMSHQTVMVDGDSDTEAHMRDSVHAPLVMEDDGANDERPPEVVAVERGVNADEHESPLHGHSHAALFHAPLISLEAHVDDGVVPGVMGGGARNAVMASGADPLGDGDRAGEFEMQVMQNVPGETMSARQPPLLPPSSSASSLATSLSSSSLSSSLLRQHQHSSQEQYDQMSRPRHDRKQSGQPRQ